MLFCTSMVLPCTEFIGDLWHLGLMKCGALDACALLPDIVFQQEDGVRMELDDGKKVAQRIILELKDKVVKGDEYDVSALFSRQDNKATEEATTALIMLGFTKSNVTKAVNAVLKEDPTATVETIIRKSLLRLS